MTSTYICDSFVGDLPDDLLSKIIEICGRESYAFLASFVRAGPRSKKLVYSTNVLRACNLSPLFFEARQVDALGKRKGTPLLRSMSTGGESASHILRFARPPCQRRRFSWLR
ncbi:unnamed protein product [Microthlaspi erraticum]|uniref:F-box domain-containing protein n=1 Tax=Microthlaspi erraticum TaxID=1685480 RepID=A0A6D2I940_9BRAS|nr:unnamed protein product [Microthlaspi erraticum]